MSSYILFGIMSNSISVTKDRLEKTFSVYFEERDSSYQGGLYYVFNAAGSEQFLLKKNKDPFDGEPVEQGFPEYPLLLYINETNRSSDLIALASNKEDLKLLREEVF
ncbi:hypothetical protein EYC55_02615 [Xanthomonas oryzae]|uniref:hypothetical protein n=1 Tax=Xanthomonas oryzae TaxID=347 RepID=UPI001033DFCD|nr:hypothetical protein [Xanthomonas oryzae]QBG94600.1 hypothetical protein EYC55_02615 [Xanthomonas oryzae]